MHGVEKLVKHTYLPVSMLFSEAVELQKLMKFVLYPKSFKNRTLTIKKNEKHHVINIIYN